MDRHDELEKLRKENKKLRKKIRGLEATIKITSQHGDATAERLEKKVSASEGQYKKILDVMPVPVVIATQTSGRFFHVNQRACVAFGFSYEEFLRQRAVSLYKNPENRLKFLNLMKKNGKVSEFEVRMKRSDDSLFSVSLSSEPITFQDETCVLTVVYDLTERELAEAKIRELREMLDSKQEKYLTFILNKEEYGIPISDIREIIPMMPVTPVPEISDNVRGVINLRGKVIPLVDISLGLCSEAADDTDQTCIIVVEIQREAEEEMIGIIVDSVSEVLSIRGKDIGAAPEFGTFTDLGFISGMTKSEGHVKILLDIRKLLQGLL